MEKLVRATIFVAIISGSGCAANPDARSTAAPKVSADATALAIYDSCFAPGGNSILQDMKFPAYALLVSKNPTKTAASRDYVNGPFATAAVSEPSRIKVAFMRAATSVARQFPPEEVSELLQACRVDPNKLMSLRSDLKSRATKIVTDSFLLETKLIMNDTQPELDRRGLVSPYR